jgi:hypothetical protein
MYSSLHSRGFWIRRLVLVRSHDRDILLCDQIVKQMENTRESGRQNYCEKAVEINYSKYNKRYRVKKRKCTAGCQTRRNN